MRGCLSSALALLVTLPICAVVQSLGPRGMQGVVGGGFILFGVLASITQRVDVGGPEPAFTLEERSAVAVGVVFALIGVVALLSALVGSPATR